MDKYYKFILIFMIGFFPFLSVYAEETAFNMNCDFTSASTISCSLTGSTSNGIGSMEASLKLPNGVTYDSFQASSDAITAEVRDNNILAVTTSSEFSENIGEFDLGNLILNFDNSYTNGKISIILEDIRMFSGSNNNFSEYSDINESVTSTFYNSSNLDYDDWDSDNDDKFSLEDSDNEAGFFERLDYDVSTNPQTSIFVPIVIIIGMIMLLLMAVFYFISLQKRKKYQ